jgi:hypothetical protein
MGGYLPISLNCAFCGTAPVDPEFEHPPGLAIGKLLHGALQKQGWEAEEPDNWRDSGWYFATSGDGAQLEVVVCTSGSDEWMLQVAPASVPGALGRLFGGQPSATPADVLALSKVIHRSLAQSGPYRDFRWRWDGPPTGEGDSEPMEAA